VRVEQPLHALAGQQLARGAEPGRAALPADGPRLRLELIQHIDQRLHGRAVGGVVGGAGGDGRSKNCGHLLCNSPNLTGPAFTCEVRALTRYGIYLAPGLAVDW